ncbi:hypothetical protein BJY00DRAFT_25716 [Aspergillus carlsbadensis]|nr:hypothetical protein BJY00DRAFT_25716 [Aspergillus carlsbadensis]
MSSRTHIHDTEGRNIASGHRYRIRLVGATGELALTDLMVGNTGKPYIAVVPAFSGSLFSIDDSAWRDKSQIQLRGEFRRTRRDAFQTLYIAWQNNQPTAVTAPESDGGFFGVRGTHNTVFLARSSSRGMSITYPGTISPTYLVSDDQNGLIEVEFVRQPTLEPAT